MEKARRAGHRFFWKTKKISDLIDLIKKIFIQNLGDEILDRIGKTRNPKNLRIDWRGRIKHEKRKIRIYKWNTSTNGEIMSRKRTLKLIYKIYDKNSTKDKEIFNKYFQRWKNSTFKGNKII